MQMNACHRRRNKPLSRHKSRSKSKSYNDSASIQIVGVRNNAAVMLNNSNLLTPSTIPLTESDAKKTKSIHYAVCYQGKKIAKVEK